MKSLTILLFLLLPIITALTFNFAKDISLKLAPLVGGPRWLPVHVKVILCDAHGFDFVPLNPTSVDTLQKLLTLQAVPAEARILPSYRSSSDSSTTGTSNEEQSAYVLRAREFCTQYNKDLHLVKNNCWSFAFDIINYVMKD